MHEGLTHPCIEACETAATKEAETPSVCERARGRRGGTLRAYKPEQAGPTSVITADAKNAKKYPRGWIQVGILGIQKWTGPQMSSRNEPANDIRISAQMTSEMMRDGRQQTATSSTAEEEGMGEEAAILSDALASFRLPRCAAAAPMAKRQAGSEYFDFDALIESVESGAVAPLRASYVMRHGVKRRQDLPPEAFWTAAELREVVELADAVEDWGHWGPTWQKNSKTREEALGHLFVALSYRWLANGEPDPEDMDRLPQSKWGENGNRALSDQPFHLPRLTTFLRRYVAEVGTDGWYSWDTSVRGANGEWEQFSYDPPRWVAPSWYASPLRLELFDKIGTAKRVNERTGAVETYWDGPLDCAIFWE